MQVAMIAQGEFMELLRAKSDDKKMIFRKLFHTELYAKIVEELGKRRKGKQQEMAQIRTVCQTEVSHVDVPEDYEQAEELKELRKRIVSSDRLSVVDMERLLEDLERLCGILKDRCGQAQKEYDAADRKHLEKRDAYTAGVQLLNDSMNWNRQNRNWRSVPPRRMRSGRQKKRSSGSAGRMRSRRYFKGTWMPSGLRRTREKIFQNKRQRSPLLLRRAKRRSGRQRQRRKGLAGRSENLRKYPSGCRSPWRSSAGSGR